MGAPPARAAAARTRSDRPRTAQHGSASRGRDRAGTRSVRVAPAHFVSRSVPGLLGPIWFQPDRGRDLPIRVGRFAGGRFESAPLQLVPVARPSREELASGAEIQIAPGRYARRQQVVYAGIYLNEIP